MSITPRDPADFTPSMGSYTPLTPFRYWCQKVLPLVYDDSLSYYEVLCKVVDYLNKTMEDVETLNGDVTNLHTAYVQLQNYVNSYFESLDVQEEINNKLDVMASDGTLDSLLLPYFNTYKDEINGIISNQNNNINNFITSVNNTVTSQNEQIAQQNTDISSLSSRMDSFTRLTEGSTTGDAELADGRIGANGFVYANIGTAIRTQDNFLSESNNYTNNGLVTIKSVGSFSPYGLNTDGSLDTNVTYRTSSSAPITFNKYVNIKVKNGFRFGYIPINGSTVGNWRGWFTGNYTIPAGTTCVIQIARVTENVAEVANTEEFTNALTFQGVIGDELETMGYYSPKTFVNSDITQGTWNDSGYMYPTESKRICVNRVYPIIKGNKFVYTIPTGYNIMFGLFNTQTGSIDYLSSWLSDSSYYIFDRDGLFFMNIKKSDNSNITPSDFSGMYVLNYGVKNVVETLNQDSTIEVNASDYNIVQGTINNDGFEPFNVKRVRTNTFISTSFEKIYSTDNTLQFGVHYYDKNKLHISNTNWIGASVYYFDYPENCAFIKLVFSKKNADDIIPSDVENAYYLESTVKDLTESNTSTLNDISTYIGNISSPYTYIGEKIPASNNYSVELFLNMSYSGQTSQDIDIFGGYVFVAFSGIEQLKVYSYTSKELLAEIDINVNHGSGIQFSAEFYDENDEFPLLYVGGWDNNIINVIRIIHNDNVWSASIVRVLYIPTSYGYFLAPSIDVYTNTLYAYGYKIDSVSSDNNAMILLKCDLNQLIDNHNDTYTPTILSSIEKPYEGVMQGRKYYNGRLYVGFAEMSTPHNARLIAIDSETGEKKTDVNMSQFTLSENEGVCYKITPDKIDWFYSTYTDIYKVTF